MLRFTHSLELALRHRDSRFSGEFWKGLAGALLFHVMLFLVFRVATMPNFDTLRPLAPVHVEIDLGTRDGGVRLESLQPPSYAMESIAPPSLDGLMTHFFEKIEATPYSKKTDTTTPDFSELERIEYTPSERGL